MLIKNDMEIGERYQIREKQKFYKRHKVMETTQTTETICNLENDINMGK